MRICTFTAALLAIVLVLAAGAADNTPPEWFTTLFNGKDLSGWKVVVTEVKTGSGVK